ncbi:hypothetical protein [Chryseobacterium wanjuense]
MKKLFLSIFILILSQAKAQIDPVKYPTYTSIDEALKSGKPVYSMSFREKGVFNLPVEIRQLNLIFFLRFNGK